MLESDQNRNTRLLSDAPADSDSFEGGHERVAEAIAGLIQDEEGGKAIALSGPYGSGKSTVVRLLKNEMEDIDRDEKEDTRIFTYDAWEHQGDPLRRSFIEGLIDFLRAPELDWAGDNAWEDERERLARRTETTEIDTKPRLEFWGKVLAVFLFLTPPGLLLVNNFIRDNEGMLQMTGPELYIWLAGAVIAAIPLLILGLTWLFGSDPFYVLVKKTRQEVERKTIRTPDPTTIEFQEVFRKIVSDALCDSKRQLIVVVDNLDRLPAERVLSTWATMRTFFENGDGNKPDWMDRFWLIVPLNFEALEGTLGKHEEEGTEQQDDSEAENTNPKDDIVASNSGIKLPAARKDSRATSPVQAFADKTFNTVFRVAPPVLSDWEQFMKEQLAEAFDLNSSDSEPEGIFHSVYRVYRVEATKDNGIPTPRDIKVFINHLSALYRQWGGPIGLPTLAAYQLISHQISPNGAELVQPDWIPEGIRRELKGEDWQEKLAALHFNVRPKRAIEVLIGEKVQTALETGNRDALREYSEIRGFESILDTTLSLVTSEKNPSTAALSAFALGGITIEDTSVGEKAWRQLRSIITAAEDWYPDGEKKGEGLVSVLRHAPEGVRDTLTDNIVRSACSCDLKVGSDIDLPNEATDWTDGMLPIVLELQNHTSFRENFHVPPNWPSFISVMAQLSDYKSASHLAHLFSLPSAMSGGGIDKAIANLLESNALQEKLLSGIRLMKSVDGVGKKTDWSATAQHLQEVLGWNAKVEPNYQYLCLELALVVEEEVLGQQRSSIGDYLLSDQGRADIFHHLDQHKDEKDAFSALSFLIRLFYDVKGNRGARHGSAPQGHNIFKKVLQNPKHAKRDFFVEGIADLVEKFDIINQFLKVADHDIANNFVVEVICTLSEREVGSEIFTHDVICDHADIISKALSEDQDAFQDIIIQADSEGELSARLREVDQYEWLNRLKEESELVEVVLTLASEAEIELPVVFRKALLDHAVWTIEEHVRSRQLSGDRGSRVLAALSLDLRRSFLKSLQRKLIDRCGDQNIAPAFLMYETALQEFDVIANVKITDPDGVVNESFNSLINRADAEELKWLHQVLQDKPNLEKDVDESTWTTFKETVRSKGSELDGTEAFQIKKIAEIVGVELDDFGDDHGESMEE